MYIVLCYMFRVFCVKLDIRKSVITILKSHQKWLILVVTCRNHFNCVICIFLASLSSTSSVEAVDTKDKVAASSYQSLVSPDGASMSSEMDVHDVDDMGSNQSFSDDDDFTNDEGDVSYENSENT